MNNPAKLYIRDSLFETAQMFSVGAALTQTYMAAIGLTDGMIGTAVSAMGIVNVFISVLLSKLSDKTGNIKKTLSSLFLVIASTYLFFTVFSFRLNIGLTVTFIVLIFIGFVQSATVAVRNLFEYKLPFLIFDMNRYARILTLDGVIAGFFSVLFSIILNIVIHQFEYFSVMRAGFFFAFILTCFSAYTNRRFVIKNPDELEPGKSKGSVKISELIKRRDFYFFAAPNFLRGISAGVVNMAALIALSGHILDSKGTAYIVTATTVGNIAGSLLYTLVSKRVEDKHMCLLGSALMASMVLMPWAGSAGYIVMFFLANLGVRMISYSYPLMVYKLIPYEIIGTYNTLRMILTTAGTAAATYLTGHLLGSVPVWAILITAFVCQALSAAVYLRLFPKMMAEKAFHVPSL